MTTRPAAPPLFRPSINLHHPMNPAKHNTHSLRLRSRLVTTLVVAMAAQAHAADGTWIGTTAGNWSDTANWTDGIVAGATTGTTSADIASFPVGSAIGAVTVDANRNISGMTISGSVGTPATLSFTGGSFLLSSGGKIEATSTGGNVTIGTPMTIQGNGGSYTLSTSTPGTNRNFNITAAISGVSTTGNTTTLNLEGTSTALNTISGVISDGTGGGRLAVNKSGTGQWTINGATFTGGLTVTGGTIRTANSGNTSLQLGSGQITLDGGSLTLGSTGATNLDNALSVGAGGGNITFRSNHSFNPSALTGTGTLNLFHSNSAGTVITTNDLRDFAGNIALNQNGANSLAIRLGNTANYASGRNAGFILNANTSIITQAGTNGAFTIELGALSGAAGSSIGGSGAGTGIFTYQIGNRGENTTFAGNIVNGGSRTGLAKVGAGSLTLTGTGHTFNGGITINGGSIVLGGNGLLPDANNLVLGGGKLDLAGFSETLADLSLVADTVSTIDFGAGASTFFVNSVVGTGALSVLNWTSGSDLFRVGADPTALLPQITINGLAAQASFNGGLNVWELSAIPEPSAFAALAGLGALGCAALRRRRRA